MMTQSKFGIPIQSEFYLKDKYCITEKKKIKYFD
jgi:hypothetical protein